MKGLKLMLIGIAISASSSSFSDWGFPAWIMAGLGILFTLIGACYPHDDILRRR